MRPPDWETVYQWQRRAAIIAVIAAVEAMFLLTMLVTR